MKVQHQTIVPNSITTTVGFATLAEAQAAHRAVNPKSGILGNQHSRLFELVLTKSEVVRYFEWYVQQAEPMTSDEMYRKATQILRDCPHDGGRDCEVSMSSTETIYVCCECWNAHVYARQAARKAQLAEHKATLPTCDRCGKTGANWTYGPYQLCGRCKIRTEREHWQALAATGNAAFAGMIASKPLTDTRSWAMNTNKGAA